MVFVSHMGSILFFSIKKKKIPISNSGFMLHRELLIIVVLVAFKWLSFLESIFGKVLSS